MKKIVTYDEYHEEIMYVELSTTKRVDTSNIIPPLADRNLMSR